MLAAEVFRCTEAVPLFVLPCFLPTSLAREILL